MGVFRVVGLVFLQSLELLFEVPHLAIVTDGFGRLDLALILKNVLVGSTQHPQQLDLLVHTDQHNF